MAGNMSVRSLISEEFSQELISVQSVSGGDICESFRVELNDGRTLFIKTRPKCPPDMFPAEARGLRWLRETKTLRVPEVIAATESFLALEFLQSARPDAHFHEELGLGLAQMHRFATEESGLDHNNFIGPLKQVNQTCDTWPEFYAERRLRPLLKVALGKGIAPRSWIPKFENLFSRLHQIIPKERLSRLHGDLWGGNIHIGPEGTPCLIDPAVYAGHREVDLAMMRLFGGFSPAVFHAYNEAWPLLEGHQERVSLYQIYPLLVHLVLFGGSYASPLEQALDRFV